LAGLIDFQHSLSLRLIGQIGGTRAGMPCPSHINAVTAFITATAIAIVIAILALAAPAQVAGDKTAAPKNGEYIPSEHCMTNPKIEGCTEDKPADRKTVSTPKWVILVACGAPLAAAVLVAFSLTVTTRQKAIFEERLFELCIALMSLFLSAIFFFYQQGGG
jgi:hypothetical protein